MPDVTQIPVPQAAVPEPPKAPARPVPLPNCSVWLACPADRAHPAGWKACPNKVTVTLPEIVKMACPEGTRQMVKHLCAYHHENGVLPKPKKVKKPKPELKAAAPIVQPMPAGVTKGYLLHFGKNEAPTTKEKKK